jgi:hypothetical protein
MGHDEIDFGASLLKRTTDLSEPGIFEILDDENAHGISGWKRRKASDSMGLQKEEEAAMTLQNRVDPFGAIHADPARGTLTGNRGIIHDPATRTLTRRRWTTNAWICCRLDFGNRRRQVMATRSWTELFFLDEATALAAGHRPCFLCRREAAMRFQAAWAEGNGVPLPRAADMDAVLHRARLASGGKPRPLSAAQVADLPEGAMVAAGRRAFCIQGGAARPWRFSGLGAPVPLPGRLDAPVALLTPPSVVRTLRAGYSPERTDVPVSAGSGERRQQPEPRGR